ncbi:MAG: hypothetical protein JSV31_08555 [Desulfobacterales bacterium]|nr:MAG: hypothetical protein JSV31_08555 [Desulfobacterales bacterium]
MLRVRFSVRESQAQFLIRFKEYGNNFRAIFALLSLIGLLYCFGCSGANYGSLKNSRDVTQAFETYHVYPKHRYYHLHLENNPYAVIALQNSYTISDKQWREFDPQTDKLEKTVDLVKRFPVNYSNAYGSYLMDSLGNQIGYWYSSLRIRSLKVDNEAKKVSIYTDTPWLRDNERGFGTGIGVGIGSGGSGIGIRLDR